MITGAARAEAALLVIDAKEGVQENSRRHGYMMSMLGIRQIAVLVNKMDLVGYDQAGLRRDRARVQRLSRADRRAARLLSSPRRAATATTSPAAAPRMPWYHGPTVLEALDRFETERPAGRSAVPHAGAGRLQVHRAGR